MIDEPDEVARSAHEAGGRWFWLGFGAGWAVIVYGLWGIVADHDATNPSGLVRWVIGGALVHDLLLAPAVLLVGVIVARWLPEGVRGPIAGALALSGIVVLFAYPLVRGYGRHAQNASTLPLDYTTSVIVVVALIWATAFATIVVRRVRQGRR